MSILRHCAIIATAVALASCDINTAYHHFEHISSEGWERGEAVKFGVPPVQRAGVYTTTLDLRSTTEYPYEEIALVVEQKHYIAHKKEINKKPYAGAEKEYKTTYSLDPKVKRDTVHCQLMTREGLPVGEGIHLYQHSIPLHFAVQLAPDDSLRCTVRHLMSHHALPGIADIGIHLERK